MIYATIVDKLIRFIRFQCDSIMLKSPIFLRRLLLRLPGRYFHGHARDPDPCRVLHVRNLSQEVSEGDLVALVQPFGPVTNVFFLRTWNQALVQMENLAQATKVVKHFASRQASVRGRNVFIQYSSRGEDIYPAEETGSKILLVTILHPSSSRVTIDELNGAFCSFGTLEKIAMVPQSAALTQAFIQYATPQGASKAMHSLHGRKTLHGLYTLEVHYSRTDEVRVNFNNDLGRDFTNTSLFSVRVPSILGAGNGAQCNTERCTLLVSNLNAQMMDERKLFSLFSVYGNIMRIKGSFTKPELALVQMRDAFQAELAMKHLRGVVLFGKKLEITLSRHARVRHHLSHYYYHSPANRFVYSYVKKCSAPSKVIHASNLAQDIQEVEIIRHLAEHGMIARVELSKLRPGKATREALVEFTMAEWATEAIACKQWTLLKGVPVRLVYWKHSDFLP